MFGYGVSSPMLVIYTTEDKTMLLTLTSISTFFIHDNGTILLDTCSWKYK